MGEEARDSYYMTHNTAFNTSRRLCLLIVSDRIFERQAPCWWIKDGLADTDGKETVSLTQGTYALHPSSVKDCWRSFKIMFLQL